jgi:uridine kinase
MSVPVPPPTHPLWTPPEHLAQVIKERTADRTRPLLVALDGRSGAGKSTLAARLAVALDAVVIDGDGFYAGGVHVRSDTPEQRAAGCIDWRRQRPVLEALRAGRAARYFAFDWHTFDGRLQTTPTLVEPKPIAILEGVYSARPELAALLDLRLCLSVPEDVRQRRLLGREGALTAWELQWHRAEDWYFQHAAPLEGFDVVVEERHPGASLLTGSR